MPRKTKTMPKPDLAALGKMISHQERLDALVLFTEAEEPMSPKQVAAALDGKLPNISYHVTQLVELGAIELRYTLPRRGAVEHFYSPAAGIVDVVTAVRKVIA